MMTLAAWRNGDEYGALWWAGGATWTEDKSKAHRTNTITGVDLEKAARGLADHPGEWRIGIQWE